jgi:hypothetical protein
VSRSSVLAVVALAAACERPSSDEEGGRSRSTLSDSALRASPGYVVDSALPSAELLRRFRVGVDRVAGLDGAASRELLVKRFFTALETRDANAMHALAVTRAEYAWLVFPGSTLSAPPYNQPPDIAWLLLQAHSNTGMARVLERDGGGRVRYLEHACAKVEVDGTARVHSSCTVRVFADGQYLNRRLFGSIVEHNGRFKLLSFANDY